METRRTVVKLFVVIGLVVASFPLRAQSTVAEMVDKGMSLMIDNKYQDALTQFKNAITLDPKIQDSIQPYIDKCNKVIGRSKPVNKPSQVPKFAISTKLLDFKGLDDEKTITITMDNGDWEAEALEDWCKVTMDKTFKEATVVCDNNFSGKSRKCLISFNHDDGDGYITEVFAIVRQKSEKEILKVKDGYIWRNDKPDYLMLESTGDLVFVNLECNTEWTILHKPEDVEVSNDSGDMTKLVIRIAPIEGGEKYVRLAKKLMGTLVKDYITLATVNQDVRLTIQVEKYKLGKTQEEKEADQAKRMEKKELKKTEKAAKEVEKPEENKKGSNNNSQN